MSNFYCHPGRAGGSLAYARLARGLFKNALADMVGISGTAVARSEEGVDKPQQERLAALAASLNFPIDFFLRPEWPERPGIVFWRSRAAETQHAREMTEQRMTWLCEIFSYLERALDFPVMALPELAVPHDFRNITPELIERATEALRDHWKLRDQPIPDVILALENVGIPVVTLDISSDKQDGFCFYSHQLSRHFVGINTYNVSAARLRYDAAHELGHAVLHRNVTLQQSRDTVAHKLIEQQAHRFAGAFLFPRKAFIANVGSPSLDYFCSLKKHWGMSIVSMVYRAYNLGLIDEDEKTSLYRGMSRRNWRGPLQEPFDSRQDMPLERPRMLRRGVEVVLNEGIFGRSTLLSAISLPEREMEQIVGVESGFFNDAAAPVQLASLRKGGLVRASDMETGIVLEFPQRNKSR
jgi:Zn-dependent peptidase ImmA (M78 family)/transcriptional regulator with XRE-family HTH domain